MGRKKWVTLPVATCGGWMGLERVVGNFIIVFDIFFLVRPLFVQQRAVLAKGRRPPITREQEKGKKMLIN